MRRRQVLSPQGQVQSDGAEHCRTPVPCGDSQEERTCALCHRVKVPECDKTPELPAPSQSRSRKSIFCAICKRNPEPMHEMTPRTLGRGKVTRKGVDSWSGRKKDTAGTCMDRRPDQMGPHIAQRQPTHTDDNTENRAPSSARTSH